MMKLTDIPVDLSTGQASIEIPVYTISTGKLTIPVSLSYDASGIKVEQNSSEVGLGWSLVAGGNISRIVRDKDDITAAAKYSKIKHDTWNWDAQNQIPANLPLNKQYLAAYSITDPNLDIDGIPDIFLYSYPGGNGRFCLTSDNVNNYNILNKVVQIPRRNIAISGGYNTGWNKWNITDESGNSYTFGGDDNSFQEVNNVKTVITTTLFSTQQSLNSVKNVWPLTKIVSYDKTDEVTFEYEDTYQETFAGRGMTQLFEKGVFDFFSTNNIIDASSYYSVERNHGKVLKKITFNNGTIEFIVHYNSAAGNTIRKDIYYPAGSSDPEVFKAPRLDGIVIKDKEGNVIKEVAFFYNYFIANNFTLQNAGVNELRLKLDHIEIVDGDAPLTYQFQYNTTPLPSKSSFAADHWGYYNGAGNSTLIPSYNFINPELTAGGTGMSGSDLRFISCNAPGSNTAAGSNTQSSFNGAAFAGADRDANPAFTQAGVLQKIIYPTGGIVSFEYENHDVASTAQTYLLHQQQQANVFVNKTSQTTQTSPSSPSEPIPAFPSGGTMVNGIANYAYSFTIPNNAATANGAKVKLSASYTYPGYSTQVLSHIVSGIKLCPDGCQTTIRSKTFTPSDNYVCWDEITLLPGDYIVSVWTGDATANSGFSVTADLRILIPQQIIPAPSKVVGGLRVKKISYDDHNGTITSKNYTYRKIDDPQISSGFTHYPVTVGNYVQNSFLFRALQTETPNCWQPSSGTSGAPGPIQWVPCCYGQIETFLIRSNPDYITGDGANVHYKYVTVTENNGANGKTVYEYSDAGSKYLPWQDGMLLHERTYNANNQLVSETVNEYDYSKPFEEYAAWKITDLGSHPCKRYPDITTPQFPPDNYYDPGQDPCLTCASNSGAPYGSPWNIHYKWEPVRIRSEWLPLKKTTSIQYQSNGSITQTQEFTYDDNNYEVASIKTTRSDGRKNISYFKYPTHPDYTMPGFITTNDLVTGPILSLQQQHMHNQVIEKYSSILDPANNTEKVTGGEYIQYANIPSGTNTVPLKNEIYNLETVAPLTGFISSHVNQSTGVLEKNNAYRLQNTVAAYDTRLNPTEIDDAHGVPTSMIWMYNKEYITATAHNAPERNIAFSGFETPETGNWTYQQTGVVNQSITGKKAFDLQLGGTISKQNIGVMDGHPGLFSGNFIVSYWKKIGSSGTVNVTGSGTANISYKTGNTITGTNASGQWIYCEHRIIGTSFVEISGNAVIDELRLYPVDAQMETYNYNPLVGIISKSDASGLITFYEYDALGRLSLIRDQYGKIIKKYEYRIQQPE